MPRPTFLIFCFSLLCENYLFYLYLGENEGPNIYLFIILTYKLIKNFVVLTEEGHLEIDRGSIPPKISEKNR